MKFLLAIMTWFFTVLISVSINVLILDTYLIVDSYIGELQVYFVGSLHVPFLLYYFIKLCNEYNWLLRTRFFIVLVFVIATFIINPYAILVLTTPIVTGEYQFYLLPIIAVISILIITDSKFDKKNEKTNL